MISLFKIEISLCVKKYRHYAVFKKIFLYFWIKRDISILKRDISNFIRDMVYDEKAVYVLVFRAAVLKLTNH